MQFCPGPQFGTPNAAGAFSPSEPRSIIAGICGVADEASPLVGLFALVDVLGDVFSEVTADGFGSGFDRYELSPAKAKARGS